MLELRRKDSYQPTGYRIEERYVRISDERQPYHWVFRCSKCDLAYPSEGDRDLHSRTRKSERYPSLGSTV